MKNNLYKKIAILEKKIEMQEEFSNEISHYISQLEQELEEYKKTLVQAIENATQYINERLDNIEKSLPQIVGKELNVKIKKREDKLYDKKNS